MPPFDPYASQGVNTVVLRPQRQAAPLASALGEGLSDAGKVGVKVAEDNAQTQDQLAQGRFEVQKQQLDRARGAALATGAGGLAALQEDGATAVNDLRNHTLPGAPGHADKVRELVTDQAGKFIDSLPDDPEVRERFAPLVQTWARSTINKEIAWQQAMSAQHQGKGVDDLATAYSSDQYNNWNPATVHDQQTALHSVIDGLDVPGNIKETLLHKYDNLLYVSHLEGAIKAGKTDYARAALKDPAFNFIDVEKRSALLSEADNVDAAAARDAQIAQNEAKRAALDHLKGLQVDIKNGTDVPATTLGTAFETARKAGVGEEDLKTFAYLGEESATRGKFRNLATPIIESEAQHAQQLLNDGKLDAKGQRRLNTLNDMLGERDDKSAVALSTLWKEGPEGQATALQQLRAMSPERRFAAAGKMGSAPNAALLASLPDPKTAQTAIEGHNRRTVDPDAFMPLDTGKPSARLAEQKFRETLGGLWNALGGSGQLAAAQQTAIDFYVGSQGHAGSNGGWNDGAFAKAINIVFGATARPGDGVIQGGIGKVRGHTVELPPKLTAPELDRVLSRQNFAALGAVYDNKQPAMALDVLNNYQPLVQNDLGNGAVVYRFEDASGRRLKNKAGRTFLLKVGAP